jgi:hypothetical protein
VADDFEAAIDPSWWRTVVNEDTDSRMPSLSRSLVEPARNATAGLQAQVLEVLAIATSAMLQPSKWNEPFHPMAVFDGRRTSLPSDLDDDQRALLRRVAHTMDDGDNASLRARVCDVGWFYGGRADVALLDKAIAAYAAVPLTRDIWHADGRDEWHRGLELAIRRGADGQPQLKAMASALLSGLRSTEGSDGFFGVQLIQMVRENRLASPDERADLAALSVLRAAEARSRPNRNLEQAWEQEAAIWFRGLGLRDDASAAQVRRAESLASKADDRRQGVNGAAMTASHFVEQALKALHEVPRAYRVEHGLDSRIAELRTQLGKDRQLVLEGMVPIRSDPIDLSEPIPALIALGMVAPIASFTEALAQAREERQSFPLSQLFGSESYSSTGQKVSSRSGADLAATSGSPDELDDAAWSAMVRNQGILTNLFVSGRIMPALEAVTLQHWYPAELMFELCRRNALIPSGREWSWARGLLHGFDGDFPSAVAMLSRRSSTSSASNSSRLASTPWSPTIRVSRLRRA